MNRSTMGEIDNFVMALDVDAVHTGLLLNSEQIIFHYDDGKAIDIRHTMMERHTTYVRLYDLPP